MATARALPPDWRDWPIDLKVQLRDRLRQRLEVPWKDEARPEQLPPGGDWQLWLLRGGRGAGKTRTGAEWLAGELEHDRAGDVSAIVAPTFGEARDKCVEGISGLERALKRRGVGYRWNRSLGEMWLENGAKVIADEAFTGAVKVEGENLKRAWCDELRNWRRGWGERAWDEAIKFAVRVGRAQIVVTTTLKPTQLVKRVISEADVTTHMRTVDNIDNLSEAFRKGVVDKYTGTRLGSQELEGLLLEDVEDALWQSARIEELRVDSVPYGGWQRAPIVGVDPADGKETGAEHAYAVVGLAMDHGLYLVESDGMRCKPAKYAAEVIDVARRHGAKIVVEVNHGGEWLMTVFEQAMRDKGVRVPLGDVHAAQGKRTRAEPVSTLYEQGHFHHVGTFPELEEQLTSFTGAPGEPSPDRLDALVWAAWEFTGITFGPPPEPKVHAYTDGAVAGVHRWS